METRRSGSHVAPSGHLEPPDVAQCDPMLLSEVQEEEVEGKLAPCFQSLGTIDDCSPRSLDPPDYSIELF